MNLELQFKLKSNPLFTKYLHEHSYWYKTLNRNPNKFNDFVEEMKINYKLRPSDKIDRALSTFEMLSTIISTLNKK